VEKKIILLVDDETEILTILKNFCSGFCDEVHTAENGQAALEILENHSIGCIVSDIKMPEMSGVELLEYVREKELETPFIFLSGFGNEDHIKNATMLGAFDFFYKPLINTEPLKEAIIHAFERNQNNLDGLKSEHDKLVREFNCLLEKK
jgi:YesN/AraC family two-component response regulator